MSLSTVAQLLTLCGLAFLIWVTRSYFPSYVKKKAENLATKEDLAVLTNIAERIRDQLSRANLVHRVQFEAEFRYYEKVWDATHRLFQWFVRMNPRSGGPALPATEETFKKFLEAHNNVLRFALALGRCR